MAPSKTRDLPLPDVSHVASVTDQIFDMLYERVVNLTLPPGAKLSEAEIAAQMGASRQPVRDAFYRLSQMGFIQIRPQRATTISPISIQAVLQAYFIRSALEEQTMRVAATVLTTQDTASLDLLIDQQEAAIAVGDYGRFHALDDRFHRDICVAAGLEFVWTLVKDHKGHMDRARYLSLSFGAPDALMEHRAIMTALRDRNPEAAADAVRGHLGHIRQILDRLSIDRPEVFA
jgi:DNA-binding GntR family transcriptional regulator